MHEFLGSLKDINMISITVRVLMSMLCGGGIGIEKGTRPAAGRNENLYAGVYGGGYGDDDRTIYV